MDGMKKYLLHSLCLLMVLLLASCMGESGDKTTYFRNGVAVSQPLSIYTTDGETEYPVTFNELETMPDIKDGDCFQLEFTTNFMDTPSGSVFKVDLKQFLPVTTWSLERKTEFLPDSIPTPDEQLITLSFRKSQLIKDRYFVPIELREHMGDQKDFFTFIYNPDSVSFDSVGPRQRNIYELYIRSSKEMGADTIGTRTTQIHAFVLDDFMKVATGKEVEKGEDSLHFRFNYPNNYNVDTTRLRWSKTDLYSIKLPETD